MRILVVDDEAAVCARTDPDAVQAVHDVLAATANTANPEEVQVSQRVQRAAAPPGRGRPARRRGRHRNVMVVSVLERRSEIGLRRSLGSPGGTCTCSSSPRR